MTVCERLAKLRSLMQEKNIDIYVVPSSDYHLGEYVGDHFLCREFISGFTGSAGTVIVTMNEAGLWTDGRYFTQSATELQGSTIELYKLAMPGVPNEIEFIKSKLPKGGTLGFDGKVISLEMAELWQKELVNLNAKFEVQYDLVGEIWADRPPIASTPAYVLEEKYAGETVTEKLTRLRAKMTEYGASVHIISSLDDIAWFTNLRGDDIPCNPVNMAYAIIYMDHVVLYADKSMPEVLTNDNIQVKGYNEIYNDILGFTSDDVILIDPKRTNYAIFTSIQNSKIVRADNPSILMKAMKNQVQIENLRTSHLKDGVAVTKFMCWLKSLPDVTKYTEYDFAQKMESLRQEQDLYIEPSFGTIACAGANGAIMHYKPSKDKCAVVENNSFFLIDSGGQYYDGTTDITRTYQIGEISHEWKYHYTLVLKGMLNLAHATFMHGIAGTNLDILARAAIWEACLNYNHGTGHGVGYVLNVHEGPQNIRPAIMPAPMEVGMVTSDEPGLYFPGSHGIRIENELLTVHHATNEFGTFLKFEILTLAPIDLDPVLPELLTDREKEYLNAYHKTVYDKVSPHLTESEREMLQHFTRAI